MWLTSVACLRWACASTSSHCQNSEKNICGPKRGGSRGRGGGHDFKKKITDPLDTVNNSIKRVKISVQHPFLNTTTTIVFYLPRFLPRGTFISNSFCLSYKWSALQVPTIAQCFLGVILISRKTPNNKINAHRLNAFRDITCVTDWNQGWVYDRVGYILEIANGLWQYSVNRLTTRVEYTMVIAAKLNFCSTSELIGNSWTPVRWRSSLVELYSETTIVATNAVHIHGLWTHRTHHFFFFFQHQISKRTRSLSSNESRHLSKRASIFYMKNATKKTKSKRDLSRVPYFRLRAATRYWCIISHGTYGIDTSKQHRSHTRDNWYSLS